MMSDVNVILAALPDAGFQIGGVDVELGAATPKLTVEVNIGQAIRQDKIKARSGRQSKQLSSVGNIQCAAAGQQPAASPQRGYD